MKDTESVYLAHISEDGTRRETVLEHLTRTAECAAQFASTFGEEEQGRLAGMAHDIGKYSEAFQKRIRGAAVRVDHSTAGAFECAKAGQNAAGIVVAGHHGGLPDWGGQGDTADDSTFWGRMKRAQSGLLPAYGAFEEEISTEGWKRVPVRRVFDSPMDVPFYVRMLYSCLVDADFIETAAFMKNRRRMPVKLDADALLARLSAYSAGWFPPKTPLNEQRCAMLRRCESAGEAERPGLFTLTIPTGGGKTVASMAFALRHAKAFGKERIIYVIPYTSIIEQNAAVFRDIFGDENVLEHHSDVLYEIRDEGDAEAVRKAEAVENWDCPIVVTTAVQFFESLFANRSSRCRKLHHIANSVIVFDEAQMLPLPYLRPCVYAIAQLVKHYRVSAVLCTATQPALEEIFKAYLPNERMREICPDARFDLFKRVIFRSAGKLTEDALAKELNAARQVLCIVNTRKAAQSLFQKLEGEGCYHLSTMMMPCHRKQTLAVIRDRLKQGLPCRVISTSLIEAGVDVDFPQVYREISGLDSVMQAAGRCNREGKKRPEDAVVTVFEGERPPPALFSAAVGAGRAAMKRYPEPDSREAIQYYFKEWLSLNGEKAQDKKDILSRHEQMQFREVAEDFHLIEENTRTVYIPTEESAALIDRLRQGERSRALLRQLSKYGVSVYERHFRALVDAGAVECMDESTAALVNAQLYSAETGLALQTEYEQGLLMY